MSYFKGFFPSWAESTCLFISLFLEQLWSQMLHLNGFFFSLTDSRCLFKWPFCEKLWSKIPHLDWLISLWYDEICWFKMNSASNSESQRAQIKCAFLEPTFVSFPQVNGSSFISRLSLRTTDWCISNMIFLSNCNEHLEQYQSLRLILIFFLFNFFGTSFQLVGLLWTDTVMRKLNCHILLWSFVLKLQKRISCVKSPNLLILISILIKNFAEMGFI